MKIRTWPGKLARGLFVGFGAVGRTMAAVAKALAAPIGFREILLFGGSALLGIGAWLIYPPAGYLTAGAVLAGVAVLGVRA